MEEINRRAFLKLIGMGSVAVTMGSILPLKGSANLGQRDILTFRATAGLPNEKIPSYATYVVEGRVNLAARSGIITKTVFAGPPEATSTVALPGLTRLVRVTNVEQSVDSIIIDGVIDDRSLLHPGESPTVQVEINQSRNSAETNFLDNQHKHRLELSSNSNDLL